MQTGKHANWISQIMKIFNGETFEKRFPLSAEFKVKEDENFTHRNTLRLRISRINPPQAD
jgi:hypothetical protein